MLIKVAFLFLNVNLRKERYAWTCPSIYDMGGLLLALKGVDRELRIS
jgi:hypothetical protein